MKTKVDTSEYDGNERALRLVQSIIRPAAELNQSDLESLCNVSLVAHRQTSVLGKHGAMKSSMKPSERKMVDIISSGISTLTDLQTKNFSIRFGSNEVEKGLLQRPLSVFSGARKSFLDVVGSSMSSSSSAVDSHDYEDVVSDSILSAPITELCVIQRGEAVPNGFLRISRTPSNKKANLNASSGGNHLYFCIKKDASKEAVPITALVLIFPDKSEFVPPGYFVARHDKFACNLNSGTSSERIFLCYKKDKSGNPITDLTVIFPGKSEEPPKSFNLIEKSPTNIPANLNTGTVGGRIFLCYRQILIRLDCLLNEETFVSATGRDGKIFSTASGSSTKGSETGKSTGERSRSISPHKDHTITTTKQRRKSGIVTTAGREGLGGTRIDSTDPNVFYPSPSKPYTPPKNGLAHGVSQIQIAAVALSDFSDDETGFFL